MNDRLLKLVLASHPQRRRIQLHVSYCAAWSVASGVWRSSSSSSTGTLTSWWARHIIVQLLVPPILIVIIIVVVIINICVTLILNHTNTIKSGKNMLCYKLNKTFLTDYIKNLPTFWHILYSVTITQIVDIIYWILFALWRPFYFLFFWQIAIYGKNFCVSAKNAFMLLMRNVVRFVLKCFLKEF